MKFPILTIFFLVLSLFYRQAYSQFFDAKAEIASSNYQRVKEAIILKYKDISPGKFGEFVKGVKEDVVTNQKVLALTLDACGGPNGNGFDKDLIDYLRKEKIPATLFISGLWIDQHLELFKELSQDSIFEIENHGLHHRPCSVRKERPYGIEATDSIGAAIDEMELNARKIEFYTSHRPLFYRSATAETDESCAKIAKDLGMTIVGFEILSGDVGGVNKTIVRQNILNHLKNGAIIIGHFNHPEWNTYEALKITVPTLQKLGYKFILLQHHKLTER